MSTYAGVINSPVSIKDICDTLGITYNSSNADLGKLCTHSNINTGSIVKPIGSKSGIFIDTTNSTSPTSYWVLGSKVDGNSTDYLRSVFGMYIPYISDQDNWTGIALSTGAFRAFNVHSIDLITSESQKLWNWVKPTSYFRLSDFNHYDQRECSNYYCVWNTDEWSESLYNYGLIHISTLCSTVEEAIQSGYVQSYNMFLPRNKFLSGPVVTCTIKTEICNISSPRYVSFNEYTRLLFDFNSDSNNLSYITNAVMFSIYSTKSDDFKTNAPAHEVSFFNTENNTTAHECSFTSNIRKKSVLGGIAIMTVGIGQYRNDGNYNVPYEFIIPKNGFRLLNPVYRHSLGNINGYWNTDSTATYDGGPFFNIRVDFTYTSNTFFGIPEVQWNNSFDYANQQNTCNILILYAMFYSSNENKTYFVKMLLGKSDHHYYTNSNVEKINWFGSSPMDSLNAVDYYYTDTSHTVNIDNTWNLGVQNAPSFIFNASLTDKKFSMHFICDAAPNYSSIIPQDAQLEGIVSSYYNYKTHVVINGRFNSTTRPEFVQMN